MTTNRMFAFDPSTLIGRATPNIPPITNIGDLVPSGDPFKDYVVIDQDPGANEMVAIGTSVDLIIAPKRQIPIPVKDITDILPQTASNLQIKGLDTIDKVINIVAADPVLAIAATKSFDTLTVAEKQKMETVLGASDADTQTVLNKISKVFGR